NITKNYSSRVQLRDPARSVDREFLLWMNNPLRYSGDTLYQSSFDQNEQGGTILQVATNPGWLTPYIACMIVGIGMAFHFGSTLLRFVDRRNREAVLPRQTNAELVTKQPFGLRSIASPAVWF